MIGRVIDRFRIVDKLGQGGMGSVWRAEDTLLHRPVALKILGEEWAQSPAARRRFLREARAASSLSHPCIATVYGAGEAGTEAYIALALIEGETVSDCAARQAFAPADAARLGVAVAEALGHAHSRGVIHRDVTGRNIMIDRDGRVFVLDFGLAMMTDRTRLTTTMATMGTAAYLSPEVALGRDADPRTDLYGLGVVLYEALTGTLPFRHDRAEALLFAAVHEAPEAPSVRCPGLPTWVDPVILRLLEKQPEDRYQDADALIADLRRFGNGESGVRVSHALAESAGSREPEAVPARANSVLVVPFSDHSPPGEAGGEWAPLAPGLSDVVRAALAGVAGLEVIAASGSGMDPASLRREAHRLGARRVLSGSVRRIGARVRLAYTLVDVTDAGPDSGETIDGSVDALFAMEDRLVASVLGALRVAGDSKRPGRAGARDPEAHRDVLAAIGYLQHYQDEASVDRAIGLLEGVLERQGESASILAALGRAYASKYRIRSERQWEVKTAETCNRALELDPHAPDVLVTLGELHNSTGHYEEATRSFEQAIQLREEHPEAYLGLSLAHQHLNRFPEAEEACRRLIALKPESWVGYNRLGVLHFRQGQFARAIEPWRMTVRLAPEYALGHYHLGAAYFHVDRFDDALESYRRSNAIEPTPQAWTGIGTVHYYLGRHEESAEAFEKAVGFAPQDPKLWGNLASASRRLPGHERRAHEALDRAIALMLDRLEINPHNATDWVLLAGWFGDRGQAERAIEAADKALSLAPYDAWVMARAGIAYNDVGRTERALELLAQAVRRGYGVKSLLGDPGLANLRDTPEFRRIVDSRSEQASGITQHTDKPGGRE